ncbi:MAG: glucose-6-phosphate isomerase [Thermodesulfovibrionales bacterium]|nr:glucose-6-phosphate isomerase [Thermodesulfovibrionales bacterium]
MLKLFYSNIMNEIIGDNGLSLKDFESLDTDKVIKMIKLKQYDELAFIDLPQQQTSEIKEIAKIAYEFDNFLLIGIGGSALGPRSIVEALSPYHNLRKTPKVFIYDNVDPLTLSTIFELIDLKKTLINVISKSGSTAETAASFMIVWQKLKERGISPQKNMIITTDPKKGNLRKIVNDYNLKSLPIDPKVVGRYSVLSPVGLLTAQIIGVNCEELLLGAEDITQKCILQKLWDNPALLLSSAIYLLDKKFNRNVTVMLPYTDRLKSFSEWFCQLWAESLGKQGKGLTPYPSVGTTDQHSQLQAWMEGLQQYVVIFISLNDYKADFQFPDIFNDIDGLNYLRGHSLAELIKIEQEATEIALSKNGKPSLTINIPSVDGYYLGQLFHLFSIATAMTGFYYGVNPFNQPGVEEGKDLTYGMMGKKGYENKKEEFTHYREKKYKYSI